jgi:diaminopimelate epimerase
LIEKLCDRRFGIGGDGLIFIQNHPDYDFEMVYFNADGFGSSMCGNGGRCAVAFAKKLGIIDTKTRFLAIDGEHEAIIETDNWVELKMADIERVEVNENHFVLDTGSPHYVKYVDKINEIDVFEAGRNIRYNERFKAKGINVNFVEITAADTLKVATYERGVEAETLACGTGVTACALTFWTLNKAKENPPTNIKIKAKGGDLSVRFEAIDEQHFQHIWLCGGADFVFEGVIGNL